MSQAMALLFSLFCGNAILAVANAGQDERKPLMREEASKQVHVGHAGMLADVSSHTHAKLHAEPAGEALLKAELKERDQQKAKTGVKDLCNHNYLMGTDATNDCTPNHNIIEKIMCQDAAACMSLVAGRAPLLSFQIEHPAQDLDFYPLGCYKSHADAGALWFNPSGPIPNNATGGEPVCYRPKYANATKDTNDGGCTASDEYQKIMNEDDCRTFAECTGQCTSEFFRVGVAPGDPAHSHDNRPAQNGAAYFDKRPEGCFIAEYAGGDGCVYFNVPRAAEDPTAANIQGIGVCVAVTGHHGNSTGSAPLATIAATHLLF